MKSEPGKTMECSLQILSLICLFTVTSCRGQPNPVMASPFRDGVVYVQARNGTETSAGTFGDIWAMDLPSGNRFRLTNDTYFDEQPLLSGDGAQVIFVSKRAGSFAKRLIEGVSGQKELYRLDLATGEIRRLDKNTATKVRNLIRGTYNSLQWHPNGVDLLFFDFGSEIYQYSIARDSVWIFRTLNLPPGSRGIREFSLSPSASTLVYTVNFSASVIQLFVLSLATGETRSPCGPNGKCAPHLGDWTSDSKNITYYEYFAYHMLRIDDLSTNVILENSDSLFLNWSAPRLSKSGDITFLGSAGPPKDYTNWEPGGTEVVQYERQTNRVRFLSTDKSYKTELRTR